MVAARMAELKEQFPCMFSHPERRPNEIAAYCAPLEATRHTASRWRDAGLKSARVSSTFEMGKLKAKIRDTGKEGGWREKEIDMKFWTIFVDQKEFVLAEQNQAFKRTAVSKI